MARTQYGIELETRTETAATEWGTNVFYPAGSLTSKQMRQLWCAWVTDFVGVRGFSVISASSEPDGTRSIVLEPGPDSPYYADVRITTWEGVDA